MMKKKMLLGIVTGVLSASLLTSVSPVASLSHYDVKTTEDMSIQTTTAVTQPLKSTTTTTAITTTISEEQAVFDDLAKKESILFGEFQRERAILSGKLASDTKRLTLDEVTDIINRCTSYDEIYKELADAQTYPDFIGGSGVTKVEYWFDDYGYQKLLLILEQEDAIYVQCNDWGKITDWNLLYSIKKEISFESYQVKMIGSFYVYNDISASDTISPSEEIYTGTQATEPVQTTTTTTAVSQPTDEKQALLDKLTEKENILFGEFQRERAVISGEFDPKTPRLTLDEVNEIINNSASFNEMYKAFATLQLYPDFIGGSGVTKIEYWLDDTGAEKVRLILEQEDIAYVKCDDKGCITDWNVLYRENNTINLERYKAQMIGSYMIYNDVDASGDINCDGDLSISDVVMFQKWLLGVPDTELINWKAADFCKDNRLDAFDLCLMKRALIEKMNDIPQNVDTSFKLQSVADIRTNGDNHTKWTGYIARSENDLIDIIEENEGVSADEISLENIDDSAFNEKSLVIIYGICTAGNSYSIIDDISIKGTDIDASTVSKKPEIATPDMLYRRYIYIIDKNAVTNVSGFTFNDTSSFYQNDEKSDVVNWFKDWCRSKKHHYTR